MIKRYDCMALNGPNVNGQFVLFTDHESAIAAKEAEIAKLQEALMFWLPNVPDEPEDVSDRVAKDAWLLAGYHGPDSPTAESLGWICWAAKCQSIEEK